MNVLVAFGIISISVIFIEIILRNYISIKYHIDSALGTKKLVGLITPQYAINELIFQLVQIPNINRFTFIDFGCSNGNILRAIHSYVHRAIGIELDEEIYRAAIMVPNLPHNIEIYNMDMVDFDFLQTDTILYMYEPLWQLSRAKSLFIYSDIFSKLKQIAALNQVYIIYCTGSSSVHLNPDLFAAFGFVPIAKKILPYSRIIPITYRTLYVFAYWTN